MKNEELIAEIRRAEHNIEQFAQEYYAKENECSAELKFLMLINGWQNPFIALNELLKRIDADEMLLKKAKKNGEVFQYKSRYKEMRELIHIYANKTDFEKGENKK